MGKKSTKKRMRKMAVPLLEMLTQRIKEGIAEVRVVDLQHHTETLPDGGMMRAYPTGMHTLTVTYFLPPLED